MRLTHRLVLILSLALTASTHAQEPVALEANPATERALRHATPEWQTIADHLPNPQTASAASLSGAADVLRARRLPDDALEYYQYALKRGGDEPKLQNDIGVTLLELQRYTEARIAFQRAIKLKPKVGQYWNNLGAVEYVSGRFRTALEDYRRAVKFDKKTAVFRANLGTGYFELKDYESARDEFQHALKLDPNIFHSGGWSGVDAHVFTASERGRFYMEMAKMSARQHDDESTLRWLGRSAETGFDISAQMAGDNDFAAYRKDPRVLTIIQNARALKGKQLAATGVAPLHAPTP